MKICYFGDYDPEYPRHKVLVRGLRESGVEVVESRISERGIKKFAVFFKAIRSLQNVDAVFIAYSDSRFVWFVRLCTRKLIVWNAFYSLYDNWVHDRKLVSPWHPKALYYWFLDWVCVATADHVILETEADIKYFVKTFRAPREKFTRIFVGYDEHVFQPLPVKEPGNVFVVEFHGKYIPVQGVEHIVEAAHLLREHADIRFLLIGSGQTFPQVKRRADELKLENITFVPRVPMSDLPKYVAEADVCIGLLGDVPRIDQAIPNKVYEASGMQRASITADTSAIRELFTDRQDILLVQRGNPRDIAAKILELKRDPRLQASIASESLKTVRAHASTPGLGQELKRVLERLLV